MGVLACAAGTEPLVRLRTGSSTFGIDEHGSLCAITRNQDGLSFLTTKQPSPLLSLRMEGKFVAPETAAWDAKTKRLTLDYGAAGARAVIHIEARKTHVILKVLEVQPKERIELVLWGPYPTTIGDIIGETVGVVHDKEFAIGIQALNTKTLGGYPSKENDIQNEFGADDTGDYPNFPPELRKDSGFRGDTAKRTPFGSVLQA